MGGKNKCWWERAGGLGWVPSKGGAAGGVCAHVCVRVRACGGGGGGMISLPGRPLHQSSSYLITSV